MCVDVETGIADEAKQCNAGRGGKLDREAWGGGDGGRVGADTRITRSEKRNPAASALSSPGVRMMTANDSP
jgi:hypothetical protein